MKLTKKENELFGKLAIKESIGTITPFEKVLLNKLSEKRSKLSAKEQAWHDKREQLIDEFAKSSVAALTPPITIAKFEKAKADIKKYNKFTAKGM